MSLKSKALIFGAGLASLFAGMNANNGSASAERGVTINSDKGGTQAKGAQDQAPTKQQQSQSQASNKYHPRTRLSPTYYGRGVSPKEWGQYLQRKGRQRWVKAC